MQNSLKALGFLLQISAEWFNAHQTSVSHPWQLRLACQTGKADDQWSSSCLGRWKSWSPFLKGQMKVIGNQEMNKH